jgi:hypothetical protein
MIESKTIKISRSYKLFDYKNSIFRHFMLENIPPKSWEQRVTKEQHEYRIDQCPAHQRSKIKQSPKPNAHTHNAQCPTPNAQRQIPKYPTLGQVMDLTAHSIKNIKDETHFCLVVKALPWTGLSTRQLFSQYIFHLSRSITFDSIENTVPMRCGSGSNADFDSGCNL